MSKSNKIDFMLKVTTNELKSLDDIKSKDTLAAVFHRTNPSMIYPIMHQFFVLNYCIGHKNIGSRNAFQMFFTKMYMCWIVLFLRPKGRYD